MEERRVPVNCLRVGVFIRLEIPWYQHPFLSGSFKIKSQDQIETLKGLGISTVLFIPEKSDQLPDSSVSHAQSCETKHETQPQESAATEALWKTKQERIAKLRAQRERLQRCERQFGKALQQVKTIIANLETASTEVAEQAGKLVNELVQTLIADKDVVVHQMNTKEGMENVFYHSLNTMVLGLLLGREYGMDAEALQKLGLGLLFHDLGKQRVPKKILLKKSPMTSSELKLVQLHPKYGEEMMTGRVPGFPAESLGIIRMHHEAIDGTGYPDGLKGKGIPLLVRLAAVVNTYDNLCNKADPSTSMTPYQALSCMFRNHSEQLDKEIIALLVRSVGVYPPGTLVELSNGSFGLVVSANAGNALRPGVLLYDCTIPRNEALVVEMADDPDLSIVKSIHPSKLTPEVYNYLSPRTRIVYFTEPVARFGA
jgi:HD-GYP domain-containing protein (c-di-GMP phosphodiesterase class II)